MAFSHLEYVQFVLFVSEFFDESSQRRHSAEDREYNLNKLINYHRETRNLTEDFLDFLRREREEIQSPIRCFAAIFFLQEVVAKFPDEIEKLCIYIEDNWHDYSEMLIEILKGTDGTNAQNVANGIFLRLVRLYKHHIQDRDELWPEADLDDELTEYDQIKDDNHIELYRKDGKINRIVVNCGLMSLRNYQANAKYFEILKYFIVERGFKFDQFNNDRYQLLVRSVLAGHDPNSDVPFLVQCLLSGHFEIRYAALSSLRTMGADVIPELVQITQSDDNQIRKTAEKALKTVSESLYNMINNYITNLIEAKKVKRLTGIATMGEQVFEIMEPLKRFRDIGEYCRQNNTDTITDGEAGKLCDVEGNTVAYSMRKVSAFFRSYYKKAGRTVPDDRDQMVDNPANCKLFERGQGKRGTTIYELGWEAWMLTCQFLDDEEERKQSVNL